VELYGGGLWHTWFDRDLAIAGRVLLKKADGSTNSVLVNIDRPVMRVPTLAIHLTGADERAAFKFNKEDQVTPVLATTIKAELEGKPAADAPASQKHNPVLIKMLADEIGCAPAEIGDFELSVYDHHKGVIGGALNEFMFTARLDNLCSSFCALESLISSCDTEASLADDDGIRMICLFDHEECGSQSAQGAGSNMLERTMTRVANIFASDGNNTQIEEQTFRNSFVVSADMAHGVHPNYASKHEAKHRPLIHKGIVFKYNANQRYATNSVTVSILRSIADKCGVPIQEFVVRNDCPCGSTVGPILSAKTGVRTIDIGGAQLSMHSVREMCGTDDVYHYFVLMKGFFELVSSVDSQHSVE